MADRTYSALNTIGGISFFLGIIILIGGVGGGIGLMFSGQVGYAILLIIMSIITALMLMAYHDLSQLLINLENNTYETVQLLKGKNPKQEFHLTEAKSNTGYICAKCGSEVNYDDVKCKKCKLLLAVDGAVKKVSKK